MFAGGYLQRRLRLSQLQARALSDDQVVKLSEELLEYVKSATYEPHTVVPLAPFWRDHKFREGDRWLAVRLLIEGGYLLDSKFIGLSAPLYRLLDWFTIPTPPSAIL